MITAFSIFPSRLRSATSHFRSEFSSSKLPQPLRLVHFQAAILRLPGVDRVIRNALVPGHVLGCAPRFHLLQRSNDLCLRMPALAHTARLPQSEIILTYARI